MIDAMIQTFEDFAGVFKGFSFKSFFTESLPNGLGDTFTLGIIILVVLGVAECLFGWQLLRFELTLMAFGGVTALSAIIASAGYFDEYLTEAWMVQLAMITLGLIAGIFTWYHSNLAFFLGMMGGSGFLIFFLLSKSVENTLIVAVIATVLSVPLAFLLKQLLMPLIVAATSIGGALVVALSISGFLNTFLPSVGLMLLTDLTVTGLIFQVRRILKSKVNTFMRSTLRSTNSFLSRYEGDVTSISRNFFSRIGF